MREEQQLKTFKRILEAYTNDTPLSKFLPSFFKKNKQMGANDRRIASKLIYNYFRLGLALANLAIEDRLFIAMFLCNIVSDPFLNYFRPGLDEKISHTVKDKIAFLESEYGFKTEDVFPFVDHFSAGIDALKFSHSFFSQPDLYIRIHPGKEKLVKTVLEEAAVQYQELNKLTLALPNGTKLDSIFSDFDSGVIKTPPFEIQDLSSQQTLAFYKPNRYESWWDACAASGGKSLLLFSQEPDIKLVVSDIRESVLNNLDERFIRAGLRTYQKKLLDLTKNADPELHSYSFDGIILDAPCSGSGTWGRTPEMISQFEEYKIKGFHNLQKSIACNVIKYLKPGKPLIYITCSVFKEENEDVVNYLVSKLNMKLEAIEVLKGYEYKADTMFVARLIK
ncbi:MAG: RsmB/NOP family class I SAM-dependent RNA methyltransferase [Flavobacterium sp.]|nr:RsmB/NOP family class I SAM-dependent RNA methyltransferase [Pedobacter sp.]